MLIVCKEDCVPGASNTRDAQPAEPAKDTDCTREGNQNIPLPTGLCPEAAIPADDL
jgi:hypothetical protein